MYRSDWIDYLQFHECILSLQKGYAPILKLRAVKSHIGWQAVVRDHLTGFMVACSSNNLTLSKAFDEDILLADNYIKECTSGNLS
jgi:hypothetical protein